MEPGAEVQKGLGVTMHSAYTELAYPQVEALSAPSCRALPEPFQIESFS